MYFEFFFLFPAIFYIPYTFAQSLHPCDVYLTYLYNYVEERQKQAVPSSNLFLE